MGAPSELLRFVAALYFSMEGSHTTEHALLPCSRVAEGCPASGWLFTMASQPVLHKVEARLGHALVQVMWQQLAHSLRGVVEVVGSFAVARRDVGKSAVAPIGMQSIARRCVEGGSEGLVERARALPASRRPGFPFARWLGRVATHPPKRRHAR